MSNSRKSLTNLASMLSVALLAAIAIWQFYLFATFKDMQGGTNHLWWAIGAALIACVAGVYVFSGFVRYDEANEMHITS